MNPIRIIFNKEVTESVRDYRSWTTGLFWALFGPLLIGGLFLLIGVTARNDSEKPLSLPVQNAEAAPNLIAFLKQHEAVIQPAPADPQTAVKRGDLNVVLVIPADYAENFASDKTANVEMILDSSRQSAQVDVSRLQNLLDGYSSYMGRLRLVVRGVGPEVIDVVRIKKQDVATPQSRATLFISFLPYFIIFAIFNGAAPIITDSTAGERERRSLEPLLINPVPRHKVALGKLLVAFPFSIASLAIALIGFGVVFNVLPIQEYLSVPLGLNLQTLGLILVVCLPVVFLASAIQLVVASFSRSTKEAGTYLPFIGLIPSLPGLVLAFFPVKPALWTMLIPTFGQQILINQFMRLEPVNPWDVLIATLATLFLGAIFTWIAIRLYQREQIVVSKS